MTDQLPPHDDIDLALEDLGAAIGAAELHGLLTGLACAGTQLPAAQLRSLLDTELDLDTDEATFRDLRAVDATLRSQLADDELGFEMLLPDDDRPLVERVRGMAQWCVGFLAGFGTGTGGRPERELPEDVRGLLATIAEFTRADIGDDGEEGGDEDAAERDYMELVEYLRVAALTIFLEMVEPRDGGAPADVPLH